MALEDRLYVGEGAEGGACSQAHCSRRRTDRCTLALRLLDERRELEIYYESSTAFNVIMFRVLQFSVRSDEDLLLLDNTKHDLWTVSNSDGVEGRLPPPAVLLPPPTSQAVDAAMRSASLLSPSSCRYRLRHLFDTHSRE